MRGDVLEGQGRAAVGVTLLRVVVGLVFLLHGGQKVFVYGVEGVAAGFAGMGLPMAAVLGPAVAFGELLGGLALLVGLLTPWAAVGLALIMAGAVFVVHLPGGFFLPNGVEFALTLLAATVALALTGPGALAVDNALASRRTR